MTDAPPFALYNPALLPPDVLLSEFTARRPLLARLLDIIRTNAPGEPPQHVLMVGPRGMGKTTLLCAIAASIELREPELKNGWQPVVFDEESRRIGDLADFWLECIRQWESATEPALTSSCRIDALLNEPGPDIEDQARDTFLNLVDASGKRALLLIDNLNDVLVAVDDHESLMRLRSFLMSDSRVMIVGAATRWFSAVANVDKPFFEFFRDFDLHALSLEEMRECLAGVAEARGDQRVLDNLKTHPNRVESLHILTGGNPRLIRTFYRLLSEGINGELRQQLERLIDDYTPYHKAIIDALPGQQQRVLDAIALQWNPCDVKTVARVTRLPSNQVSAQIRALTKANLVSEVPAMGTLKKKAYMLTDRFSNIHYLMRHGRAGQLRMHWFVMTLRVLFDDEEFADAAARTVRLTAAGGAAMERDGLALAHAALDYAGSAKAKQRFLDRMVGSMEFDDEVDVEFAEKLCRESIVRNPLDALAHFKWGRLLNIHLNRSDEAEAAYRKAIELDPKFARPWYSLGNLLTTTYGYHHEAEAAYRKAIELDPKDSWQWNNLGILLTTKFDRHAEAEAAYRNAIELAPENAAPWNNLGNLLAKEFDRHDEAEAAYCKAIDVDEDYALPWRNLGWLHTDKLSQHEEAEASYRKAIELAPNDVLAWNGLGWLLTDKLSRHEEAEAAYLRATEIDPKLALPWSNLEWLLSEKCGRHEEAVSAIRKAIEAGCEDSFLWYRLAYILTITLERFDEAEVALRNGLELDPDCATLWNGLGYLLTIKLSRHDEALLACRKSIAIDAKFGLPHSNLAHALAASGEASDELQQEASCGLKLDLEHHHARDVFRDLCFDDAGTLQATLPEVSLWCSQHPDAKEVVSFLVDAWLALARVTTAAEALTLLEAQSAEVRLVFETLSDALIAHDNLDHLHRLAPERRAPVLKLLERMKAPAE